MVGGQFCRKDECLKNLVIKVALVVNRLGSESVRIID